ncbi:MAG: hypothetical protein U1F77_06850 [Kiritimatiellia bacterium]
MPASVPVFWISIQSEVTPSSSFSPDRFAARNSEITGVKAARADIAASANTTIQRAWVRNCMES